MKPATPQAFKLRRAFQALVEQGIEGERESAAKKLARLEARYDFTKDPEGPDIFNGTFERSATAVFLSSFGPGDSATAGFVKWAIERRVGIPAVWRYAGWDSQLYVEASSSCMPQLRQIATTIRESFASLWDKFAAVPGVATNDKGTFLLGLYDGMMSDDWQRGKPLPQRSAPRQRKVRARKKALAVGPAIALHPYSVALSFGAQIRLATPVAEIVGALEREIALLAA